VKAALRAIAQDRRMGAALVDITLGGELAFPVADALAAADVPFMWVTGNSIDIVPERFRDRPLLTKPFMVKRLLAELKTIAASVCGGGGRGPPRLAEQGPSA